MDRKILDSAKELLEKGVTAAKLEYPDENVVRFLAGRKAKGGVFLDIGCGAGRHSVAAAKMGFEVYAVDYVQACLDITSERLNAVSATYKIYRNDNHLLPLPDNSINYASSWGMLFLMKRSDTVLYLNEIIRVLKHGGEVFADFRSENDYLYGLGEKLDDGLYLLDETSDRPGLLYHFYSLDELEELFSTCGFKVTNAEKFEFTMNNSKDLNSWHHITAEKL